MVSLFQEKLEKKIPFTFTKFGDGEIICILKLFTEGQTNCDYQSYSEKLSEKLIESLKFFSEKENVFIGEWNYGDDYETKFKDYLTNNQIKLNYVAYSTLLHIEDADVLKLKSFYKGLKNVENKIYVCPRKLEGSISLFRELNFLFVKENEVFSDYEAIKEYLLTTNYDVFLYSCGLMSKVLIADILKERPNTTHIDIGSGLDNLFIGQTRAYQIDMATIKKIYEL